MNFTIYRFNKYYDVKIADDPLSELINIIDSEKYISIFDGLYKMILPMEIDPILTLST